MVQYDRIRFLVHSDQYSSEEGIIMSPVIEANPYCTGSTPTSRLEFELPSQEFILDKTLSGLGSEELELIRPVADSNHDWPSICVSNASHPDIQTTLFEDPDIEDWTLSIEHGDEWLCQPTWSDWARDQFHALVNDEATLHTAAASDGRWRIQVSVPDRRAVARLYEHYTEHGFTVEVTQIYEE